jgi:hypothetical protein
MAAKRADRGSNSRRLSETDFYKANDLRWWEHPSFRSQTLGGILVKDLPPLPWSPRFPVPVSKVELKQWRVAHVLELAAEQNCPDAFGGILEAWLSSLGIEVPEGVFVKPRGMAGRPPEAANTAIHQTWKDIGKPSLNSPALAAKYFGQQFIKANRAERQRLIDRCRLAVQRRELKSTKS